MKYAIINQHANNWGDEAASVALIEEILCFDPDAIINVLYVGKGELHFHDKSVFSRQDLNLKKISKFEIIKRVLFGSFKFDYKGNSLLRKYIDTIQSSDYIFVSPAGADIGRYRVWASLINLLLVNTCNKKVIFHLNTIGPSGNFFFDFIAEKLLKASRIYVREEKSLQYLKRKHIKASLGVDTAYLLRKPKRTDLYKKKTIVFIPSDLSSWNKTFEKYNISKLIKENCFKAICEYTKENNYNLVILQHLLDDKEKRFIYDLINYAKIVGCSATFIDNISSAFDYQEYIASAYIVVSMRYHGVVLATKNQIPVISISYENKMDEVCAYMDIEDYNIPVLKVDYNTTLDALENVDRNYNLIKNKLKLAFENKKSTARKPVIENVKF